jgi:hypothetical protein
MTDTVQSLAVRAHDLVVAAVTGQAARAAAPLQGALSGALRGALFPQHTGTGSGLQDLLGRATATLGPEILASVLRGVLSGQGLDVAGTLQDLLTRATTSLGPDVLASALSGAQAPQQATDPVAGFRDLVARATALGPDARWLVAGGNAALAGLALRHQRADWALYHLEEAVGAGYNDCVALHAAPFLPFHGEPRFRALYSRMRTTVGDLDELRWLHQEMRNMARDAQQAALDNIGRHDTGVGLLPMVPLPTRVPDTPGVLITRIEYQASQTVLQQAVMSADISRSGNNIALSALSDTWDHRAAHWDSWAAHDVELRRRRAAEARAFVPRPGAGNVSIPCPPPGSLAYPV